MRIIFGLLILLFATVGYAQQEQQYSQYLVNPFTINPAVASTEDYLDVQLGYRSQWSSFEGAPKTVYATAYRTFGKPFYAMHYKAEHKNWHGAGIHVYDDKTGPIHRNSLLLAYSYNMGLFGNTRLSVGSFIGMKQLRTNSEYWVDIEDQSDLLFAQDVVSGIKPELQLGFVMYSKDYFVTMAAHNIIPQSMSLSNGDEVEGSGYQTHVFASAGVNIVANEKVKVTPSVFAKYTSAAPISFDANLKIDHDSDYWYGFSTRFAESINVFAGMNLKSMFDITYAFEWSYSKISQVNNGTHEVILGLRLQHPDTTVDPSKYW